MSISPLAEQRDEVQHDLWARTAKFAGQLNRAHAELVDIAAELIEGGHWGDGGFRSPEHYFVVRAGLSPAHARDVVAVARRRGELSTVAESVATGALSLDQAAVVAHHEPVSHQRSVGELALHMTVPQLRRAISRHAFSVTRDPRGPTDPAEPSPDALFTAAAGGAAPPVDTPTIGQDEGPAADRPTCADALEQIAHRALSSVTSSSRSSHYRVYLHLSTDGAWITNGGAIPRRLLGRFLSDGVLQPGWETDGRPVSVGRTMRILPRRSRRLIEDRGCRFPGCTATRFVEIHHLEEWAAGGATDDDNQVSLCPFHHDAIDRGDYTISGDPTRLDGLVVSNRYGLPVRPPTPAELAPPGCGDPPSTGRGHPVEQPAYQPPTGERARWADIEIPPDRDLRPRGHLYAVPTL